MVKIKRRKPIRDARRKGVNCKEPTKCPHIHFKCDIPDRRNISPEQHINILATPKGYCWEESNKESEDGASTPAKHPPSTPRKVTCSDKRWKKPEKVYAHNFLAEVWTLLTPEMLEKLKTMLTKEFEMTSKQAEDFIGKQREANIMNSSTVSFYKKRRDIGDGKFVMDSVVKMRKINKTHCDKFPKSSLGIRNSWIKDLSELLSDKVSTYVLETMCAERTERQQQIALTLLNRFNNLLEQKASLSNPRTQTHKTMVLVADRLSLWLDKHVHMSKETSRRIKDIEQAEKRKKGGDKKKEDSDGKLRKEDEEGEQEEDKVEDEERERESIGEEEEKDGTEGTEVKAGEISAEDDGQHTSAAESETIPEDERREQTADEEKTEEQSTDLEKSEEQRTDLEKLDENEQVTEVEKESVEIETEEEQKAETEQTAEEQTAVEGQEEDGAGAKGEKAEDDEGQTADRGQTEEEQEAGREQPGEEEVADKEHSAEEPTAERETPDGGQTAERETPDGEQTVEGQESGAVQTTEGEKSEGQEAEKVDTTADELETEEERKAEQQQKREQSKVEEETQLTSEETPSKEEVGTKPDEDGSNIPKDISQEYHTPDDGEQKTSDVTDLPLDTPTGIPGEGDPQSTPTEPTITLPSGPITTSDEMAEPEPLPSDAEGGSTILPPSDTEGYITTGEETAADKSDEKVKPTAEGVDGELKPDEPSDKEKQEELEKPVTQPPLAPTEQVEEAKKPTPEEKLQKTLAKSVSSIIQDTPIEPSPRQEALKDILEKELEKDLGDQDREAIQEAASKVGSWIDKIVDQVETEYGDRERSKISVPGEKKSQFFPVSQKPKGSIFVVTKADDLKSYDVNTISHNRALEKIRMVRGKSPTRLEVPNPEAAMEPEDYKTWARWATDVSSMGQSWAEWIEDTVKEAQKKGEELQRDDSPRRIQEWKEFREKKAKGAMIWRTTKKDVEVSADLWSKKGKQTSKKQGM